MKNLFNLFEKFFRNLTSIQKLLYSIVTVLILIFFYYFVIRTSLRKSEIDYKSFTSSSLLKDSEMIYDREKYIIFEEIISKFLNTNIGKNIIDEKVVKVEDYYKYTTTENYKKCFSKRIFKNKVSWVYNKVFYEFNNIDYVPLENYIANIYKVNEYSNIYIIEINDNYEEEKTYIGIEFNEKQRTYFIMFVE